jgi:hypothetical protein
MDGPHSLRLICIGLVLALGGLADHARAGGDSSPGVEVDRLVVQLGDGDWAVRRAAAWRLREIGIPALPALRKVADSDDPEVQAAARAAIKAIGSPLPQPTDGPRSSEVIQADEQHWAVDYHEGKRVVRVEGDVRQTGQPYGHLKLTFTGPVDGKETTQVFAADSEEHLKWDSPQAWMYFHSIFNHDSDMAAVKVPNTALNAAVNEAMDKSNFSAEDRKQVMDRLHRFSEVCSRALAAVMYEPDTAPQRAAEEFRESDALRKFLTDKKLPIVEGPYEMDPPPEARLGIDFLTDHKQFPVDAQSGLLIKFVVPGERADRIGVQPDDVIQRINGTAIDSASQLTPICLATPAGMTIEVFRNLKTITLHENSDAPKH